MKILNETMLQKQGIGYRARARRLIARYMWDILYCSIMANPKAFTSCSTVYMDVVIWRFIKISHNYIWWGK
jgi:hypothetical protein